jgi:hypothetical protein
MTDPTPPPATARPPQGVTTAQIDNWFSYHAPSEAQAEFYVQLRNAGRNLALTILGLTPPGADQTAAIRKVREAIMTANAAIACGGK